ncbi:bile acid:sodium symporter [Sphingobium phenoxybenzoativorans]|uniref:Bile acid:sodium symporter n=1 Tax=Sphingobium phenoxybenzoativorans TaxID=1592790 RepID=A0A975K8D8_9SPHN|nr:bile acid:sodium symporter family protein [Sphingobium phenoxybenzoativorans]QUT06259.1 bile acid:sodium symporter [Sphingobium phenoxybenzoativorans]
MRHHIKGLFDPYILALLATVALASVLPPRGMWVGVLDAAADVSIVLLFFLHGAKLSREAILAGAGNWRLHLAVLGATFLLFPALGVGIAALPGLTPVVATGMLFLTLLPSTVQSSIAFTAIARGNVAAAVCSASFSNLLGIFVTPLLAALLLGSSGASVSLSSIEKILLQLLLPFVTGHLLRPWIGGFIARHKGMIGYVDRGSILLIVYTAFGAAVVEGLWRQMPPATVLLIGVLSAALLGVILFATRLAGRLLGLSREDAIVLLFCGSKKSLATGVPMAGVLFPAAVVGQVILPLMLFHQLQLIACALIARHLGAQADARPISG